MVGNVFYTTNKDKDGNIKYKFYLIFDKILVINKQGRNDISITYYLLIDLEGKIIKEEPGAFIVGKYNFAVNVDTYKNFNDFYNRCNSIESGMNKNK